MATKIEPMTAILKQLAPIAVIPPSPKKIAWMMSAIETASMAAHTIGPVVDYDARRGTALVKTLEAYFGTGGSLSRAAEVLHVHVNTVTQRPTVRQLLPKSAPIKPFLVCSTLASRLAKKPPAKPIQRSGQLRSTPPLLMNIN